MDVLSRSRRLLLIAYAAALGCGGYHGAPVGVSTSTHAGRGDAKEGGALAADAGIPGDFEATMHKLNDAPFVTNGHAAGRWDADVYANDAARGAIGPGRGEAPEGAMLVMVHRERPGGARGPIMMMEKRAKGYDAEHGDWRYVVVGSTGELVKDGPLESCAGCHDDAPRDHVFAVAPGASGR